MKQLTNDDKASLFDRMKKPNFLDGCHRWGWVVTLIGTIVFQMLFAAYSVGQFKQSMDDMKTDMGKKIDKLEQRVDSILLNGVIKK